MKSLNRSIISKCAAILSGVPFILWGFSGNPPPRSTGAPGDQTCAQSGCHVGTVNSPGASVQITSAAGTTYTPGTAQRITIQLTDPSFRAMGFQASARLASNEQSGQAGTFTPIETNAQVFCLNGQRPATGCPTTSPLEFIAHTTPIMTNSVSFDWTPPAAAAGDVVIYAAVNSVNLNSTNSGDRVYTANLRLTPAGSGGGGGGTRPSISNNGVVNGASFAAGIQAGSWTTITGQNLSTTTRGWAAADFSGNNFPTSLDGVRVNINGRAAFVNFISPTQVNVQAPAETSVGPVNVEVINAAGTSAAVSAELRALAPGLFTYSNNNRQYAAAVFQDGVTVGTAGIFPGATTRPAKPGDVISVYGTGFGATTPAVAPGQIFSGANPTTTPFTMQIGSATVTPAFTGISAAGLYQMNLIVPDVPNGDQEIRASGGNTTTQSSVYLTIQR